MNASPVDPSDSPLQHLSQSVLPTDDAKQFACLYGYEHWDRMDQPGVGVGGLTQGQRLWHEFMMERMIRHFYKLHLQQGHPDSFDAHSKRISKIPKGR
jgi:hypothetical protein